MYEKTSSWFDKITGFVKSNRVRETRSYDFISQCTQFLSFTSDEAHYVTEIEMYSVFCIIHRIHQILFDSSYRLGYIYSTEVRKSYLFAVNSDIMIEVAKNISRVS